MVSWIQSQCACTLEYAFGKSLEEHSPPKPSGMSPKEVTPKTFHPELVAQTRGPPLSPWHAEPFTPPVALMQMFESVGVGT